jgi:phosphate transport system permease protein
VTVTTLSPPPSGTVPVEPRRPPSPVRPRDFGRKEAAILALSAVSSLALVWVVFYQLTLLSGAFGFLLCWYVCFLAMYWVASAQTVDRMAASDRVVTVIVVSGAALVIGLLLYVVLYVIVKAVPNFSWHFLTKDQRYFEILGAHPLSSVGVGNAIIGTLEQVGVAALIGVPAAVATAVFLNEVGGRGTRLVRTVVTAMSGTPSIIAGVFIYSILIINHVFGYSGFAAALALFVLLLPLVARTTEEVLRVVPSGLREASQALGASEWRTVWSVVLPTARSGVITAVLLGVARAAGETAPLIFTAFGSQVMNYDVFSHPQSALPLLIFTNVRQAQSVLHTLAFEAAFILLMLVLILFVTARIFGRPKSGRRRRGRGSPARHFFRSRAPVPIDLPTTMEATDR